MKNLNLNYRHWPTGPTILHTASCSSISGVPDFNKPPWASVEKVGSQDEEESYQKMTDFIFYSESNPNKLFDFQIKTGQKSQSPLLRNISLKAMSICQKSIHKLKTSNKGHY